MTDEQSANKESLVVPENNNPNPNPSIQNKEMTFDFGLGSQSDVNAGS